MINDVTQRMGARGLLPANTGLVRRRVNFVDFLAAWGLGRPQSASVSLSRVLVVSARADGGRIGARCVISCRPWPAAVKRHFCHNCGQKPGEAGWFSRRRVRCTPRSKVSPITDSWRQSVGDNTGNTEFDAAGGSVVGSSRGPVAIFRDNTKTNKESKRRLFLFLAILS